MSHHLFDAPETLVDRPYSRRAGKVCGAPVPREDVPRSFADDADALDAARGILAACALGCVAWLLLAVVGVWAIDVATGGDVLADLRAWINNK